MSRQQISDKKSFHIPSAIPGRIRLQFPPAYSRRGGLLRLSHELEAVSALRQIDVIAQASSIVLQYDRREYALNGVLAEVEAIVTRLTVEIDRVGANGSDSHRLPDRKLLPSANSNPPLVRSLPGGQSSSEPVEASGKPKITRAKDIPGGRGPGFMPLIIPTVAVALAAFETLPVAVVGGALALAALPVARRAGIGVRSRKITVDELDFANILWLAGQGDLLVASAISWLITLGELIRGKTVRSAREEIARLRGYAELQTGEPTLINPVHARHVLTLLQNAPLSDTHVQHHSIKAAKVTAPPMFGLGLVYSLLSRDPSRFIDIVKPRTDFDYGLSFAAPAAALNAMTANTRKGPLFTSARAMEKLGETDTVVLYEMQPSDAVLKRLTAALGKLGIRTLLLSRQEAEAVKDLYEQGYHTAIVSDRIGEGAAFSWADVRVACHPDIEAATPGADLVLLDDDLEALLFAIRHARETLQVIRQNTVIAATASLINLTIALLEISAPPISSIINTASIAIVGWNAFRPLRQKQAALPAAPRAFRARQEEVPA